MASNVWCDRRRWRLFHVNRSHIRFKWFAYRFTKNEPALLHACPKNKKFDGQNLQKGEKYLIVSEQGLGDTVLFSSLIPELVKKVDQLIVMTDKRLIPLFKRSFFNKITYIDRYDFVDEYVYDYQIPMGSLPKILRTSILSFRNSKKIKLIQLLIKQDVNLHDDFYIKIVF